MATAIECDRCGKLELARKVGDQDLYLNKWNAARRDAQSWSPAGETQFDICRKCHASLIAWWMEGRKQND